MNFEGCKENYEGSQSLYYNIKFYSGKKRKTVELL